MTIFITHPKNLKSVRLYRMDDKMECIICQDTTSETLQDNTLCECKYKIHASCWIDYVHSKTTVTCLICRKERVESKKEISMIKPTAPPLPTIIEEQEQREEQSQQNHNPLNLVETQGSFQQTQGSLWQTEGSFQQIRVITTREMNTKIIKIIIFIVILVFVLILIWS